MFQKWGSNYCNTTLQKLTGEVYYNDDTSHQASTSLDDRLVVGRDRRKLLWVSRKGCGFRRCNIMKEQSKPEKGEIMDWVSCLCLDMRVTAVGLQNNGSVSAAIPDDMSTASTVAISNRYLTSRILAALRVRVIRQSSPTSNSHPSQAFDAWITAVGRLLSEGTPGLHALAICFFVR
jgi:hypothetical protein